jgi:hypothetical protein
VEYLSTTRSFGMCSSRVHEALNANGSSANRVLHVNPVTLPSGVVTMSLRVTRRFSGNASRRSFFGLATKANTSWTGASSAPAARPSPLRQDPRRRAMQPLRHASRQAFNRLAPGSGISLTIGSGRERTVRGKSATPEAAARPVLARVGRANSLCAWAWM